MCDDSLKEFLKNNDLQQLETVLEANEVTLELLKKLRNLDRLRDIIPKRGLLMRLEIALQNQQSPLKDFNEEHDFGFRSFSYTEQSTKDCFFPDTIKAVTKTNIEPSNDDASSYDDASSQECGIPAITQQISVDNDSCEIDVSSQQSSFLRDSQLSISEEDCVNVTDLSPRPDGFLVSRHAVYKQRKNFPFRYLLPKLEGSLVEILNGKSSDVFSQKKASDYMLTALYYQLSEYFPTSKLPPEIANIVVAKILDEYPLLRDDNGLDTMRNLLYTKFRRLTAPGDHKLDSEEDEPVPKTKEPSVAAVTRPKRSIKNLALMQLKRKKPFHDEIKIADEDIGKQLPTLTLTRFLAHADITDYNNLKLSIQRELKINFEDVYEADFEEYRQKFTKNGNLIYDQLMSFNKRSAFNGFQSESGDQKSLLALLYLHQKAVFDLTLLFATKSNYEKYKPMIPTFVVDDDYNKTLMNKKKKQSQVYGNLYAGCKNLGKFEMTAGITLTFLVIFAFEIKKNGKVPDVVTAVERWFMDWRTNVPSEAVQKFEREHSLI